MTCERRQAAALPEPAEDGIDEIDERLRNFPNPPYCPDDLPDSMLNAWLDDDDELPPSGTHPEAQANQDLPSEPLDEDWLARLKEL